MAQLLMTFIAFVYSCVGAGLACKAWHSKRKMLVFAALGFVGFVSFLVSAIVLTTMFSDMVYYEFCGARIFDYQYYYVVNCRALFISWLSGYILALLYLVEVGACVGLLKKFVGPLVLVVKETPKEEKLVVEEQKG